MPAASRPLPRLRTRRAPTSGAHPTAPDPVDDRASVVRAVAALADWAGRRDIGDRLRAAAARAARPTTIVCVVGEFKQGKSTLINQLVGMDLCPVDDDLATSALTLVHHGDALGVTVRRAEGGEIKTER